MCKNEAEQLNLKEAVIDQNQSVAVSTVNKHLFVSGLSEVTKKRNLLWKGLLEQVTLDSPKRKPTEASAQHSAAWQGHAQESSATRIPQVIPCFKDLSISADPQDLHPVICLLLFQ